jgi:hypothetical protein
MPITQAGASHEASAANIRIASAAYSSAKKAVMRGRFAVRVGSK